MNQIIFVLSKIGIVRLTSLAILVLPLALIDIGTLLGLRLFLIQIQSIGGQGEPAAQWLKPFLTGQDPIGRALLLGAFLCIYLILRAFIGGLIWNIILRRMMVVQYALSNQLFSNYMRAPYILSLSFSVAERRRTLFLAAGTMLIQVLLPLLMLLAEFVVTVGVLAVIFAIEPITTTVIVFTLLVFFAILMNAPKSFAKKTGKIRWAAYTEMQETVDATLGDIRRIKLSADEDALAAKFAMENQVFVGAVVRERILALIARYFTEISLVIMVLVILLVFRVQGRSGPELLADLMIFVAAAVRLLPSLQRTLSLGHSLLTNAPELDDIKNDLKIHLEHYPAPTPGPRRLPFHNRLQLEQVSFTYPCADEPILLNICLNINFGERIEISGPSGAGKSTLLSVILGLLPLSSGRILLDGVGVEPLKSFRGSATELVPQKPFLIRGSIAANILFPNSEPNQDLEYAEKILHRMGINYPLDQLVGDDGIRLSGGERQRLALARALCRRPSLLILDESTSQLDAKTERLVFQAIEEFCPKATIIVVSHSPTPLGFCDSSYNVSNGVINTKTLSPRGATEQ